MVDILGIDQYDFFGPIMMLIVGSQGEPQAIFGADALLQ